MEVQLFDFSLAVAGVQLYGILFLFGIGNIGLALFPRAGADGFELHLISERLDFTARSSERVGDVR